MTDRTAPIDLVRAATSYGLRAELDVNGILAAAGVSPMLLADGRSRVTESQIVRIVQELWKSTDDEMFGLGAHPLPRGSFRMLCYGLLSADSLGAALDRLSGFAKAMPALPPIGSETDGETTRIVVSTVRGQDPDGLATTMALTIAHRFIGWAIGQPVPLLAVELPHDGPLGDETYRMLFGRGVSLGAASASITFSNSLLSAPIVRDDVAVESFIASSPAGLLTRPHHAATLSDQVRRILVNELKTKSLPTTDVIARRLSMSTPTLRRHLAAENTSARQIREDLLRDAAVTSLVDTEETVADLSERLGFSEQSAFTRAFRRWTGSTPAAYRKSGTGSDDDGAGQPTPTEQNE